MSGAYVLVALDDHEEEAQRVVRVLVQVYYGAQHRGDVLLEVAVGCLAELRVPL